MHWLPKGGRPWTVGVVGIRLVGRFRSAGLWPRRGDAWKKGCDGYDAELKAECGRFLALRDFGLGFGLATFGGASIQGVFTSTGGTMGTLRGVAGSVAGAAGVAGGNVGTLRSEAVSGMFSLLVRGLQHLLLSVGV
jgi:hypothetical protein